jgi:hypothetical protein
MNRRITLTAEHLPGVLNTVADEESCVMKDLSDWMLNPQILRQIQQCWGPLVVDLFTSRPTIQLEKFVRWRSDPVAEVWTKLPCDLVGRVLTRVLVAPV